MRYSLLLPIFVVALVAFAWADDAAPPSSAERARLFQRNKELVRKLVDGGLRLAAEDEPFKRAEYCNDLAALLAAEVHRSAANREGRRAAEMGGHLHSLLHDGVAGILNGPGRAIPPGSPGEKELRAIGERVELIAEEMERRFDLIEDADTRNKMGRTLSDVLKTRSEVRQALSRLGPKKSESK